MQTYLVLLLFTTMFIQLLHCRVNKKRFTITLNKMTTINKRNIGWFVVTQLICVYETVIVSKVGKIINYFWQVIELKRSHVSGWVYLRSQSLKFTPSRCCQVCTYKHEVLLNIFPSDNLRGQRLVSTKNAKWGFWLSVQFSNGKDRFLTIQISKPLQRGF